MTRGDKLLLAGLLLTTLFAAVALYGRAFFPADKTKPLRAVITSRGAVVSSVNLPVNMPTVLAVQGRLGQVTVEASGEKIRMLTASCPGGICLKQGWIGHAGQSIVCVPGEILIRIEGMAPLDAVTR